MPKMKSSCDTTVTDDSTSPSKQPSSAPHVNQQLNFSDGTARLGKPVFDICQENEDKKRKEQNDRIKEHEIRFKKDADKANEVLQKKSDLNKMTIRELTLICKP